MFPKETMYFTPLNDKFQAMCDIELEYGRHGQMATFDYPEKAMGITRTCRLVHDEAIRVFYGRKMLAFGPYLARRYFKRIGKNNLFRTSTAWWDKFELRVIGHERTGWIQSLQLSLKLGEYSRFTTELLVGILDCCPLLKTLHIGIESYENCDLLNFPGLRHLRHALSTFPNLKTVKVRNTDNRDFNRPGWDKDVYAVKPWPFGDAFDRRIDEPKPVWEIGSGRMTLESTVAFEPSQILALEDLLMGDLKAADAARKSGGGVALGIAIPNAGGEA